MRFLEQLLDFVGLGERLRLEWISSAEAQKFVQLVTTFTEKIKSMGPSLLNNLSNGDTPAAACYSKSPAPVCMSARTEVADGRGRQ